MFSYFIVCILNEIKCLAWNFKTPFWDIVELTHLKTRAKSELLGYLKIKVNINKEKLVFFCSNTFFIVSFCNIIWRYNILTVFDWPVFPAFILILLDIHMKSYITNCKTLPLKLQSQFFTRQY